MDAERYIIWARNLPFVLSRHKMLSIPQFKNLPFIIRRFDADYNILPIKYLEEVHRMPPSIINGRAAVTQVSAGHSHELRSQKASKCPSADR